MAGPCGTLRDLATGQQHGYLFWEALTTGGAAAGGAQGGGRLAAAAAAPGEEEAANNSHSSRSTVGALAPPAAAPPPSQPPRARFSFLGAPPPDLPFPDFDPGQTFVVAGGGVQAFLYGALQALGFPPRDTTDFLAWWAPHMERYPACLVGFVAPHHYAAAAALALDPAPDALLRVFMLWEGLRDPGQVAAARAEACGEVGAVVAALGGPLRREGARLAVLEWGGMEVVGRPR